jgi:signal transduction histidine kinase
MKMAISYEQLKSEQVRRVGAAFLRLRPKILAPTMSLVIVVLLVKGLPRPQVFGAMVVFATMISFFTWEAWRTRTHLVSDRWLKWSLLLTTVGITAMCTLTGGLQSPVLPMYFAPIVTSFAAFQQKRLTHLFFWLLPVLLAILYGIQHRLSLSTVQAPQYYILLAGSMTVSCLLLRASVSGLTIAYQVSGHQLDELRSSVLEQAMSRTRNLELFGAQVAHDMKNPLASVKGLVQLLGKNPVDARAAKRIDVVLKEVDRLEQILHDYLSFSRPLEELRCSLTDLSTLVQDSVHLVEAICLQTNIHVQCDCPSLVLPLDERRFKEALLNLLNNSIEAMETHGSLILRGHQDASFVYLTIRDSGKGMSKAQLEKLGTPFVTHKPSGTGLGVTIARSIVVQHGGQMHWQSAPGIGTTVTIQLPKHT